MNTFIIPVDFSAVAATALQYGYQLALQMQCNIVVCHAFATPLIENIENLQQIDTLTASAQAQKEGRLRDFVAATLGKQAGNSTTVSYVVQQGALISLLQNIAASNALIIMGTTAQPKEQTDSGYSQTADVMLQTALPVLALPAGSAYKKPNNVVYALDYEQFDRNTLYSLKAFSDKLNAQITLLHINAEPGLSEHNRLFNYRKTIQDVIPYENVRLDFVQSDNIPQTLLQYTQQHHTDLLALLTKKGQLTNQQFRQSISNQLVMQTTIPLLVFHHTNQL